MKIEVNMRDINKKGRVIPDAQNDWKSSVEASMARVKKKI